MAAPRSSAAAAGALAPAAPAAAAHARGCGTAAGGGSASDLQQADDAGEPANIPCGRGGSATTTMVLVPLGAGQAGDETPAPARPERPAAPAFDDQDPAPGRPRALTRLGAFRLRRAALAAAAGGSSGASSSSSSSSGSSGSSASMGSSACSSSASLSSLLAPPCSAPSSACPSPPPSDAGGDGDGAAVPAPLLPAKPAAGPEALSVAAATAAAAAAALTPAPAAPAAAAGGSPIARFCWADPGSRPLAEAALGTLAGALAADPVNAFLLGGAPGAAARFARKEVKGYLRALPRAAHFYATPDASAAALWQLLPSETPRNELLAGWTRILRVPLRLWPALVGLELRYEAAHAAFAEAEGGRGYYYLAFIGTAPAARGKGRASALISAVTARADAEGRACMLEATSERSRDLYARHGFETYETFRIAPDAPPVFFMRRGPQPLVAPAGVRGCAAEATEGPALGCPVAAAAEGPALASAVPADAAAAAGGAPKKRPRDCAPAPPPAPRPWPWARNQPEGAGSPLAW